MQDAATPDEELVSLSKDGNLSAFNSLVAAYERQVFNLCLRLIGDPAAAEDAAQETFLAAFRGIRSFRGGSFRSWILRIAANQAKDELRRRRRRPAPVPLPPGEGLEDGPEIADPARGPEERSEDRELRSALMAGLQGLPFEQRQVVLLVDYLGMNYAEAAEATGSSLGTVKSRLHRGRDALRRFVLAHPEHFGVRQRREG